MHSSSLQFLIEVTFNLTLVEDSAWAVGGSWKNNNVLQLILSACLWSPMMLSSLSIQPFSPTQAIETTESPSTPSLAPPKRAPSIVRGRDLPFPTVPLQRRRTLQGLPSNPSNNVLLQQRYSSAVLPTVPAPSANTEVTNDDARSRGRTLQRTRATRPTLSRSDSRTLSPEAVEEIDPRFSRRMSRNSTLLRVPPFPLPHRVLHRPTSESPSRVELKALRPVSKRFSSIPPPLALENIYAQRLDEEDEEDSPVLGREETERLLQQRRPVNGQPEVTRDRRCSVSRAPQNL
ncbi:hypothetical protein FPV67DRAFT_1456619 [Lyophyllum atratum]|nr:hypothetical protein FPV67DRAFT_1456619 [Lyophyllum atratum]